MIFELLIITALCIAGYIFLFHKKSGATPPISSTTSQENDSIVKKPILDQKNTQEMVVGHSDNITLKEIASPEIKNVPPVVIPTQEEFQDVKAGFFQQEVSQDRLLSFVENSNIQKEDLTETKEFVPTEVEQPVFDKEIIDKQPAIFEEKEREEQRVLQETETFENKAVEKEEILPHGETDENILIEEQEEAIYQKPQEEYNLTRPEDELTIPKETEILSEEQQEASKPIEETHQESGNKPEIIQEADVEKPETATQAYEQEYGAEKEKAEEVVNPFEDEQVTTDEKPIFEDIQQEDVLNKEPEEIAPVVEYLEKNLFAPKDQEVAVETQEEEKPQIELVEVSAPIENQEEAQQLHVFEPLETPQDQEVKANETIEGEVVKPLREEEAPVFEQEELEDVNVEENPFVHNQVEEIITQEEEKPIVETPVISEVQQSLDDTETLKVENREELLAKELEPISESVAIEKTQKEEDLAEATQEVTASQSSAKKATRKGFNFRTNKTKIESIMPKLETPEKQNIAEFSQTAEENQVNPTPLNFEEKEERVEDLINELGTPIQLIKSQSSEIETPFTEQIESSQPAPEQSIEKTSAKRGFNFRTKKNKIESILQEGSEKSSSGEILKESLVEEPQVQKETEPFIKEIETIQVPETENVSKEIEPVIEPVKTEKAPTKRGFNFRANKNKIESLEKSLSQEDVKLPLPCAELLEEKPLDTLSVEEKPTETDKQETQVLEEEQQRTNDKVSSSKRGFNFRTKKNKIEAMLTSVDTPEKKLVEGGSEKSSSGEFQSMQQEIPASEQKQEVEASPIKVIESLPTTDQGSMEERDLKAQLAGKTMGAKRSFNFRANKRRIDSILKKDNSGHLDLSAENENSLSNILESTVNTSITHSTEDVLGPREENIINIGEETIEPQTKRKGFNFRNAKKKTIIESPQKQDENSIVSGITEQSNESPQKSENVLAESGKGEVKKLKGFNFRNPNRIKAD